MVRSPHRRLIDIEVAALIARILQPVLLIGCDRQLGAGKLLLLYLKLHLYRILIHFSIGWWLAGVDLSIVGRRRCYLIVDLEFDVPSCVFVAIGRLATFLALDEGKGDHYGIAKGLEHALLGD